MYKQYPIYKIIVRRCGVIVIGVLAFPVMIFNPDKGKFYSYLHRVWRKTSNKPVWLVELEKGNEGRRR